MNYQSRAIQKFLVPVGATRLVLGYVDGFGNPGCYSDNTGSVSVTVNM